MRVPLLRWPEPGEASDSLRVAQVVALLSHETFSSLMAEISGDGGAQGTQRGNEVGQSVFGNLALEGIRPDHGKCRE